MDRIFITGHKNPDLDSICAAVAYANLLNQVKKENQYIPIRCGSMNSGAKAVFKELNLSPPPLMKDIGPQVRDIAKRNTIYLDEEEPVLKAIVELDQKTISVIPVFSANQDFQGILTIHEITNFLINDNQKTRPEYHFRIGNFPLVVPGYFYKRGNDKEFRAPIMTGAMPYEVSIERIKDLGDKKPILVTGLREDLLRHALQEQFPAIILTGLDSDSPLPLDTTEYKGTIYVSHSDTAETIRLLRLSTPVKDVMNKNPMRLNSHESFDKAKSILLNSSYRGLPVFHGDQFAGIVTRRCFIEKPRPKLILVDHNELSQSINGADQAEILEIQDHHRLGTIKTREPIFCYSRPVGSTCTIIYGHYKQQGIEPTRETAVLLLAGLLSDTVVLKSPTTTDEDIRIAQELSELSSMDIETLGNQIFSHYISLKDKAPKDLIFADYKEYQEQGFRVGIGQIEVEHYDALDDIKSSFIQCMEQERSQRNLDWILVLLTQVKHGNSRLLLTPFPQGESLLPYENLEELLYDLPGVLSRKKQLLPEILRILEELNSSDSVAKI